MKQKIFTIRDQKIESHNTPIFFHTRPQAVRVFSDEINNPSSPFHKHPQDYDLYEIGTYDDENAGFDLHPAPEFVANGATFREPSL